MLGASVVQVVPLGMERRTLDASLAVVVSAPFLQVAEMSGPRVALEDRLGGLYALEMLRSEGKLGIHQW